MALAVLDRVSQMVEALGAATVRASRTQVSFRRRSSFVYLRDPGRWRGKTSVQVVLSLALKHRIESPRWAEVVHQTSRMWVHHLEVASLDDLDAEVEQWLAQAYADAR